jgi:hypothetical protein
MTRVSTFKWLKVETVSTFNLLKVETVSTFNWLKVETVSTFKHFLKTKQPEVLLYVASSILVATVLHRNNLECTLGLPTQRSSKQIQIISMHSKKDDVINEQLLINSANLWSRCQRTRTLFGQWWRKASQK